MDRRGRTRHRSAASFSKRRCSFRKLQVVSALDHVIVCDYLNIDQAMAPRDKDCSKFIGFLSSFNLLGLFGFLASQERHSANPRSSVRQPEKMLGSSTVGGCG